MLIAGAADYWGATVQNMPQHHPNVYTALTSIWTPQSKAEATAALQAANLAIINKDVKKVALIDMEALLNEDTDADVDVDAPPELMVVDAGERLLSIGDLVPGSLPPFKRLSGPPPTKEETTVLFKLSYDQARPFFKLATMLLDIKSKREQPEQLQCVITGTIDINC